MKTLDVIDKFSGEVIGAVPLADRAAVERAIATVAGATKVMAAFPPHRRRAVLAHVAQRLAERKEELARLLARAAGKPLRDGRVEVERTVAIFTLAAEEAVRIGGEVLPVARDERTAGARAMTKRVPVGAVSLVTPFNFPLSLVAHKVAPAIAAGCPFVLKPSEQTPLSARVLGELLAETDLPREAWAIVVCAVEDAAPLVEDPRLALLSFTGSSVGWALRARAGKKKVVLELGGNAACVVDADQDVAKILPAIVRGAFGQAGQSCISVQRLIVHRSKIDALRAGLVAAARALRIGDPKDEATDLGPMIDAASAERLAGWVHHARDAGAAVLTGGDREGAMLTPTVVEGVPAGAPLRDEEAFGPVVLLEAFDGFAEALAKVNDSRFGLQAGVFTNDLAHAMAAWDTLEVGGVIVGDVPTFRADAMPYGGVKDSGVGREGVRAAIADMTEERVLVLRG